jgi:hypothetical protein
MIEAARHFDGYVALAERVDDPGIWMEALFLVGVTQCYRGEFVEAMLEQYLAPADGPTVTATATIATSSPEPAQVKPVSGAKKRARVSRPIVRAPDAIAVAQFESRWVQRTERRRGWRLFGRFARAE